MKCVSKINKLWYYKPCQELMNKEFIGPSSELCIIILLSRCAIELFYIHTCVCARVCSCNRSQSSSEEHVCALTVVNRAPQLMEVQTISNYRVLSLEQDVYIQFSTPVTHRTLLKNRQNDCKI